ncbi:AMP-binding protein, partial [Acinetobacter baumannii]
LFVRGVHEFAGKRALESFGVGITYSELGRAAGAIAAWLQSEGLGKGDRVAIMLPNVAAYFPLFFGVLQAGCTVVNVNPL